MTAQGTPAQEKPAKFTDVASDAALEWLSGVKRFFKYFQHARKIVWMDRNLPAPTQRLFLR
jgi:hypothetical protein